MEDNFKSDAKIETEHMEFNQPIYVMLFMVSSFISALMQKLKWVTFCCLLSRPDFFKNFHTL